MMDSFISVRSLGAALDTMSWAGGIVDCIDGEGGGLLADVIVPVVGSGLSHRAMSFTPVALVAYLRPDLRAAELPGGGSISSQSRFVYPKSRT